MRSANVYMNGELAGKLTEKSDGTFTFSYADEYFKDLTKTAISLTLPKNNKEYHSKSLFPFFFNMLSEGVNKETQIQKFKIDEHDYFGLLLATAQEDTIGAITIKSTDDEKAD